VEKPHAVAVGDRCRVDTIDEVVEGLLDPAEDGDDELAHGTIDDVVAVRDAVAQEDEVAGHSRRCLLTEMNAVLAVEDVKAPSTVSGTCRGTRSPVGAWLSRRLNTSPVSTAEASSEQRATWNRPTAACGHDETRAGHRVTLRWRPDAAWVLPDRSPPVIPILIGEQCGCLVCAAPGQGHSAAAVAIVVHAPGVADLLDLQPHARPPRS